MKNDPGNYIMFMVKFVAINFVPCVCVWGQQQQKTAENKTKSKGKSVKQKLMKI